MMKKSAAMPFMDMEFPRGRGLEWGGGEASRKILKFQGVGGVR